MMKRHAHKVKAEVNCLRRALKSCCVLKQAEKSTPSGVSHLETHLTVGLLPLNRQNIKSFKMLASFHAKQNGEKLMAIKFAFPFTII